MADRIRFHLDEHVDPAVAIALRRAGIDVTTTNEVGLRTQDDKAQLNFVRTEVRVIVTRDHDFLALVGGATEHPGVAFLTASKSLREIIEGLIVVYEVMTPREMAGRIEYNRISVTLRRMRLAATQGLLAGESVANIQHKTA